MKFLAIFTLLGTIFTSAPQDMGFFVTVVPNLQGTSCERRLAWCASREREGDCERLTDGETTALGMNRGGCFGRDAVRR